MHPYNTNSAMGCTLFIYLNLWKWRWSRYLDFAIQRTSTTPLRTVSRRMATPKIRSATARQLDCPFHTGLIQIRQPHPSSHQVSHGHSPSQTNRAVLSCSMLRRADRNILRYTLLLVAAPDIPVGAQDAIYDLFDKNMYSMSVSLPSAFFPCLPCSLHMIYVPPLRTGDALTMDLHRSMNTSFSYTEQFKRLELFEPTTKYILCLRPPHSQARPKGKIRDVVGIEGQLVGYCSFRFDTEETLSSRDAEVIYWSVLPLFPLWAD